MRLSCTSLKTKDLCSTLYFGPQYSMDRV